MIISIGATPVDFIHENGTLLGNLSSLRQCFGLTTPEFESLRRLLPPSLPAREGYIQLSTFLIAMNKLIRLDADEVSMNHMAADRLAEYELRVNNYVFLTGFMGRDLLGATELSEDCLLPDGRKTRQKASQKEIDNDFAAFSRQLKLMTKVTMELFEAMDKLKQDGAPSREYFDSATSLLDILHTATWTYISWYSKHVAGTRDYPAPLAADLDLPVPDERRRP